MRSISSSFVAGIICSLGVGASLLHGQVVWDGGGSDEHWHTPENWDGDTLPDESDEVYLDGDAAVVSSAQVPASQRLYLATESGATASLDIQADFSFERAYIGYQGSAIVTHSAGDAHSLEWPHYSGTARIWLGYETGAHGEYHLSGDGRLLTSRLTIGRRGTALFTQDSGSVGSAEVRPSLIVVDDDDPLFDDGGSGTFELSGTGSVYTEGLWVGDQGVFSHSGGTVRFGEMHVVGWEGNSGLYELSGGELIGEGEGFNSEIKVVGGAFIQNGGHHETRLLTIGGSDEQDSHYTMSDGDLITEKTRILGTFGDAFIQSGGNHINTEEVVLGAKLEGGDQAAYRMSNNASLTTPILRVGEEYTATFEMKDDAHVETDLVTIGTAYGQGGESLFEMTDRSSLTAGDIRIGYDGGESDAKLTLAGEAEITAGTIVLGESPGSATVDQQGGSVSVASDLWIGRPFADGVYSMTGDSRLFVGNDMFVGLEGKGAFTQDSGEVEVVDRLTVGRDGEGIYTLNNGSLKAGDALIGFGDKGNLAQSGGSLIVGNRMAIGRSGEGAYTIVAGEFSTANLWLGNGQNKAEFKITGNEADISITNEFIVAEAGELAAVQGSSIRMTGADFKNLQTDSADLAGLKNLTFLFDGGEGDISQFEVSGLADGGFIGNFAVGKFTIGDSEVGHVQLVDLTDNGQGGGGLETLFLHELLIGDGSSLDLNGLRLYLEGDVATLLDAWIGGDNTGRLFDSTLAGDGFLDAYYDNANDWTTFTIVPEPTSSMILLSALALLLRRRA